MSHHRIGWLVVTVAAAMIVIDGLVFAGIQHITAWHGIYCIWMTAYTVGGDVQPVHGGYWCLALAPVPLLAAAFTLFTSALSSVHVRKAENNLKQHIEASGRKDQT